jgi:hypothetical protein
MQDECGMLMSVVPCNFESHIPSGVEWTPPSEEPSDVQKNGLPLRRSSPVFASNENRSTIGTLATFLSTLCTSTRTEGVAAKTALINTNSTNVTNFIIFYNLCVSALKVLPDSVPLQNESLHIISNLNARPRGAIGTRENIALEGDIAHTLDAGESGVVPASVTLPGENNAVISEFDSGAETKVREIAERICELATLNKNIGDEAAVQTLRLHILRTPEPRHEVGTE